MRQKGACLSYSVLRIPVSWMSSIPTQLSADPASSDHVWCLYLMQIAGCARTAEAYVGIPGLHLNKQIKGEHT
jgi:hypothetical protein